LMSHVTITTRTRVLSLGVSIPRAWSRSHVDSRRPPSFGIRQARTIEWAKQARDVPREPPPEELDYVLRDAQWQSLWLCLESSPCLFLFAHSDADSSTASNMFMIVSKCFLVKSAASCRIAFVTRPFRHSRCKLGRRWLRDFHGKAAAGYGPLNEPYRGRIPQQEFAPW